jgi:hypothetical protein
MRPDMWSDEEEIDLDEYESDGAPHPPENTDAKLVRSRENDRQRRWLSKLTQRLERETKKYPGIQLFVFGLSGYSALLSMGTFKSSGFGKHMKAIHDDLHSYAKDLYLIDAGKEDALSSMDDFQLRKWKRLVKPGIDLAYETGIFSSTQVEAFWTMVNDVNLGKNCKDGE